MLYFNRAFLYSSATLALANTHSKITEDEDVVSMLQVQKAQTTTGLETSGCQCAKPSDDTSGPPLPRKRTQMIRQPQDSRNPFLKPWADSKHKPTDKYESHLAQKSMSAAIEALRPDSANQANAMPAAADASAASPQAPQTDAEPAAPECIAICEQEAVDRDLERLIIRGDALLQQSLQREDQRAARIEAERLQRETGEVELEEEEEEEEDDSFVSETFLSQLTFESPEEPKELERQRQRQAKKAQEDRIAKEEDAFASRRHRKRREKEEEEKRRLEISAVDGSSPNPISGTRSDFVHENLPELSKRILALSKSKQRGSN